MTDTPPTPAPPSHPIEEHDFFKTGVVPKRDERPILPDVLAEMAASNCPMDELAGFFGFTEAEFTAIIDADAELKRVMTVSAAAGRAVIRRRQYQMAKAGDTSMLRHTGEHILKQNSKIDVDNNLTIKIIRDFTPQIEDASNGADTPE